MISLFLAGDVRGMPHHGLCRDGLLYEYDGTTPVMDTATSQQRTCANLTGRFVRNLHRDFDPAQIWFATCTATARAPGVPAVSRSVDEQAIDAVNGHTWLDYLPVPRGETGTRLHGRHMVDTERRRNWLRANGRGDVWRARITACALDKPTDTWTITIRADRYGRHLEAHEYVEHTIQVTGCGIPANYAQQQTTVGFDSLAVDETDDGGRVLVGLCEWYTVGNDYIPRLLSIVEIDLIAWPLEPLATVLADYADCVGTRQWTTTTTYSGYLEQQADECSAYGDQGLYATETSSTTQTKTATVWAWYHDGAAELLSIVTVSSSNGSTTHTEVPDGYNVETVSSGTTTIDIKVGSQTVYTAGIAHSGSSVIDIVAWTTTHNGSVIGSGGWTIGVDYNYSDSSPLTGYPVYELCCIGQCQGGTTGGSLLGDSLYPHAAYATDGLGGGSILFMRSRRLAVVAQIYWPGHQAGQYAICAMLSPLGVPTAPPPPNIQTGALYFAVDDQHGQRIDTVPSHWM